MFRLFARGPASFEAGPVTCAEWSGKEGFANTSGRTEVPTHSALPTISAWHLGQSNAISIAATGFTPSANVQNYNYLNGKNYVAAEPLLGTEAFAIGGYPIRLGSKTVDTGLSGAGRYVITNSAIGGVNFSDYYPPGTTFADAGLRPRFVIRRMLQAGLRPSMVCCQMGETAAINAQSAGTTTTQIRAMVKEMRDNGCIAPVFLARGARYGNYDRTATRQGIADACDDAMGIFLGPDTDTLDNTYRPDTAHFSATGLGLVADLWLACLQAWLAAVPGRTLLMN